MHLQVSDKRCLCMLLSFMYLVVKRCWVFLGNNCFYDICNMFFYYFSLYFLYIKCSLVRVVCHKIFHILEENSYPFQSFSYLILFLLLNDGFPYNFKIVLVGIAVFSRFVIKTYWLIV